MKKLCLSIGLSLCLATSAAAAPPKDVANGNFRALGLAAPSPSTIQPDYKLGPFDKVSVTVVGQKDLSVEKTQIDSSGNIVLPLVGVIAAGGKTASQLSSELENKLSEKYLESPHVSVLIDEAVSQRVTVSGSVVEPGNFSLKGRTTLLQAVAMAKGPDVKNGDLRHVAIFREIDGRPAQAVFDLKAIEQGKSPDPEVLGGDSVVVEGSAGKTFWHELIASLPSLGAFAYLHP